MRKKVKLKKFYNFIERRNESKKMTRDELSLYADKILYENKKKASQFLSNYKMLKLEVDDLKYRANKGDKTAVRCLSIKKKSKTKSSFYFSYRWVVLRDKVIERYGAICMKCGSTKNIHVDHIVPRDVDRKLEMNFNNLQVLCKKCNEEKGSKTEDYRTIWNT